MLNVHMLEDFADATLTALKAQLDVRVHLTAGRAISPGTHILIGGRPAREQLVACAGLRAVIVPWAGVPDNTRELLRDLPHHPAQPASQRRRDRRDGAGPAPGCGKIHRADRSTVAGQ
jgi:hypothetical protein